MSDGKDQAYGIESKKGFVNYVLARDAQSIRIPLVIIRYQYD